MALRLPTRIPIRVRTAAALSIPLVMLMVVAGLEITQSGHDVADVREQSELATASIGPAGAINALMTERNYTSLWLFGVEASVDLHVESLEDARDQTDASLAAFEREVRRRGGRAERIYGPAIEALEVLDENRAEVDAYDGERNPTVENESGDHVWAIYNRLVSKLAAANNELAHQVEDDQLRLGVRLVDMSARQVDKISKIVRLATISAVEARGPITDRTDFGRIARMMSEADRHHETILRFTTGPYAELREPLQEESDATGIFGIEQRFAGSGEVDIAGLLRGVSIDPDESYYGFIHDVSAIVQDRADDLEAAAAANQRRIVILCGLLLVAAAAASLVVARSITRPLGSLTRQAQDMATRRLPEAVREVHELPLGQDVVVPALSPVAVASRDEVGDVAEQLNAVQMAALDLAVEQAVMRRNFADVFVNLCRRIQSLLGRQLELIADVTEPAPAPAPAPGERRSVRRAPDLSEVSRYAIRLRRHAESLLVLAGVEPRPVPGVAAPLHDVVRATLDEVSGAERVRVMGIEPVIVAGPAVADLAHLLAELVESALREIFPEETVDLAGAAGADGYTLSIVDPGSGMAEDEIERANRRLAGDEADTTAPSKYLGQYVAARLAARHGISVTLHGTMRAGVTATVHLPPGLLRPVPPPGPAPTNEVADPAPDAASASAAATPPGQHGADSTGRPDATGWRGATIAAAGEADVAAAIAAAVGAAARANATRSSTSTAPPAPAQAEDADAHADAAAPDPHTERGTPDAPGPAFAADADEVTGAPEAGLGEPDVDVGAGGVEGMAAGPEGDAGVDGLDAVALASDADADAGRVEAGGGAHEADGEDGDVEAAGVLRSGPGAGGSEDVALGALEAKAEAEADAGGFETAAGGVESDSDVEAGANGVETASDPSIEGDVGAVGSGANGSNGHGDSDGPAGGRGAADGDGGAEAATVTVDDGKDPHPSGPNYVVPAGGVDVYTVLADFPEGVERPALATPTGTSDDAPDVD
jgi:signal transduction histidine kinase